MMNKASLSALFLWLGLFLSYGQDTNAVYSHSKQFVVIGRGATLDMYDRIQTNRQKLIALNPHYLAVSTERIKEAFLREIRQPDQYQSRIYIRLLDKAPPTQPIAIISSMYTDGWRYEMGVPAKIEEPLLIKSIIQVLLLEYANRRVNRSAELPAWVVEGFTQEIANSPMPTYLFEARVMTMEVRGGDELTKAREWLRNHPCLTIDQLSFANLMQSTPEEIRIYQSCAQLLVHELLKLPNGPALFASFLSALPHHWNWQTAFLKVYHQQFKSLLHLEKWWALTWLDFRGRADAHTWSVPVSIDRLRMLLTTSMETRASSNSIPVRSNVSLQTMISKADFSVQQQILKQKLQQLHFLKFNLSPAVQPLAHAYQDTLQRYIDKRSTAEYQPGLKQNESFREQAMNREIIQALDALDEQHQAVLAKGALAAPVSPPNSVVVQTGKKNKTK